VAHADRRFGCLDQIAGEAVEQRLQLLREDVTPRTSARNGAIHPAVTPQSLTLALRPAQT
jgi:hypothetical protein